MSSRADPPTAAVEVAEFTDPGCVWSWSSEPVLRWLRHHYGERVRWRRVLGIQIDDLGEAFPDGDAVGSAEEFRSGWLEVAAHTGAPITGHLEWIHTSTRPAAHAVKAAELQGDAVADAVLRRLREAVFVLGRPADDEPRILAALDGTPGLDVERLLADLGTAAIERAVQDDYVATRQPRDEVIGLTEPEPHPGAAKADGRLLRYAFPTLLVRGPAGERVVPGWRSAGHYLEAFEAVAPALRGIERRSLDPDTALARYRSLSVRDLELLTGGVEPPSAAVRIETATAPLWLHPSELAAQALPPAWSSR